MLTAWLLGWIILSQIYPMVSSAAPAVLSLEPVPLEVVDKAASASPADGASQAVAPQRVREPYSMGVDLTARNFLAMDVETQTVLLVKDAYRAVPIASLTKLLTGLLLAEQNIPAKQEVIMAAQDEVGGARLNLVAGEKIYFEDLLRAALIESANNGIMALVRASGKTKEEWALAMNAKARALGMTQSNFTEPTGLDPRNVSTAYDVALLARAAFQQPQLKDALLRAKYSFRTVNGRAITAVSTDKLLGSFLNDKSEYTLAGGKTGYLNEAGYCLAAEVVKDQRHILTVVLGSRTLNDRFQDTKGLAYWVFNNYLW